MTYARNSHRKLKLYYIRWRVMPMERFFKEPFFFYLLDKELRWTPSGKFFSRSSSSFLFLHSNFFSFFFSIRTRSSFTPGLRGKLHSIYNLISTLSRATTHLLQWSESNYCELLRVCVYICSKSVSQKTLTFNPSLRWIKKGLTEIRNLRGWVRARSLYRGAR